MTVSRYNDDMAQPTTTIAPKPTIALPALVSADFLAALRAAGVVTASIFGSFARGEETASSDVDLLVTFNQPTTLFDQLRLADRLQAICGRRVDLMTELHPVFVPYITPTLLPLPI
jgi:predicted nucleotidyltransferase